MTVDRTDRLMRHILKYLYARMVLDLLPHVVIENCYGCEVDHPSQVQHTCLMWTKMEHLGIYFDTVYKKIDEKDIVNKMKNQADLMDAPYDYKQEFISTVEDWCIQHKPNAENLLHWCKRMVSLEERLGENFE